MTFSDPTRHHNLAPAFTALLAPWFTCSGISPDHMWVSQCPHHPSALAHPRAGSPCISLSPTRIPPSLPGPGAPCPQPPAQAVETESPARSVLWPPSSCTSTTVVQLPGPCLMGICWMNKGWMHLITLPLAPAPSFPSSFQVIPTWQRALAIRRARVPPAFRDHGKASRQTLFLLLSPQLNIKLAPVFSRLPAHAVLGRQGRGLGGWGRVRAVKPLGVSCPRPQEATS